jgi:ketopantoate hydroxymethyltransferase
MYLDPALKDSKSVSKWHHHHLHELQTHAMTIVGHLTELMPEHVHEIGGHKILA